MTIPIVFTKYAYEERTRYFEFKRDDGRDGLATGETLTSPTVTCADADTGADCSSSMISGVSVVDDTKVAYTLKAGTAGSSYILDIRAVTTTGQKLEGKVEVEVE